MSERFVLAREGCDLAGERWPGGTTIAVWDATIWQRDTAGRWRIAVDISTPLPPGRR